MSQASTSLCRHCPAFCVGIVWHFVSTLCGILCRYYLAFCVGIVWHFVETLRGFTWILFNCKHGLAPSNSSRYGSIWHSLHLAFFFFFFSKPEIAHIRIFRFSQPACPVWQYPVLGQRAAKESNELLLGCMVYTERAQRRQQLHAAPAV